MADNTAREAEGASPQRRPLSVGFSLGHSTITVTRRAEVSGTARYTECLFDSVDDVTVDTVTGHRP